MGVRSRIGEMGRGAIDDREADIPASLSTGEWALADWNRDRFAGVLFLEVRSRLCEIEGRSLT